MSKIQNTLTSIVESLNLSIQNHQPISGGDISDAYLVQTNQSPLFIKMNSAPNAKKVFELERAGLEAVGNTKTIKVPKVFLTGEQADVAFLAMEFIPSKRVNDQDYNRLGVQLAQLHQCSQSTFGFENDNFIGRLPQSNERHENWTSFYIEERLLPQFKMAVDQNLLIIKELPKEEELLHFFDTHFSNVRPSLLHGDLWSGNYLISETGEPYLIDPATYYGDRIVDIAMTQLFGGFGASFYQAYHSIFPKEKEIDIRVDLYQLYYLLVHLNLFGKSYYSGVKHILKKYFE